MEDSNKEDDSVKAMSSTNKISVARTRVLSHGYSVKQDRDVALMSRIRPCDQHPPKSIESPNISTCLKTSRQFRMSGYLDTQEHVGFWTFTNFSSTKVCRWVAE